ncbi:hypothetical protein [Lonsdalea quercina]|uniref:hypothetical protein n=1 Tax=Lonsdalea quercina TaxID=71657 RepID=UPI003975104E
MTNAGFNHIVIAKILIDRFGFCRGLNYDESFTHNLLLPTEFFEKRKNLHHHGMITVITPAQFAFGCEEHRSVLVFTGLQAPLIRRNSMIPWE